MKKLMIFLLCFLLTGCAAPQAGGSESSGSSGSAPSGSVSSPQEGDASSQTPAPDASQEGSSSASEEPAGSSSPSGSSSSSSGTGSDPLPQNKDQIIQELVSAMSVEEKVGQMFFVRCPETDQAAKVSQYKLGGYILFGRDFKDKTAQQVRDEIASYQASSGIPMLIGTDEEGGTVVRASSNPNLFPSREPSPQVLYAQGGLDAILQDARQKSVTLLDLGVNVNFAPVADVSTDPADFIYERALGQDAQTTADYVAQVVTAMGQERIGSVLKHFPGYGNNQDTHTGVAVDERPYETFETSDFLPFQAGIQAGADAVLVSHNIVNSMDESLTWPWTRWPSTPRTARQPCWRSRRATTWSSPPTLRPRSPRSSPPWRTGPSPWSRSTSRWPGSSPGSTTSACWAIKPRARSGNLSGRAFFFSEWSFFSQTISTLPPPDVEKTMALEVFP